MSTNYASHGSSGSTGVIVAIISTSIAFIVLILRLLTRSLVVRNVGAEDYVILIAFTLSVALTALICVETQHGQGMYSEPRHSESEKHLPNISSRPPLLIGICRGTNTVEQGKSTGLFQHYAH
jgi:hypothetical protein